MTIALIIAAIVVVVIAGLGWCVWFARWQMEYSQGCTLANKGTGFALDIPADGHANYITRRSETLAGKSRIVIRYRAEGSFTAKSDPGAPTMISAYFQRRGDDWQTDGYRWFAGFAMHSPISEGEHEIIAPLDGPWGSVMTMTAANSPGAFSAAKADTARVGFVLGGGTGLGHGIVGPGKITVTSFTVE